MSIRATLSPRLHLLTTHPPSLFCNFSLFHNAADLHDSCKKKYEFLLYLCDPTPPSIKLFLHKISINTTFSILDVDHVIKKDGNRLVKREFIIL
jgi:hypothetical protein